MITLGNIITSYYNGLQTSNQLDRQNKIQEHLVENDQFLLASIKEGQKTNKEQNVLTSVLNESVIGKYPFACPPPCHHKAKVSALGPWIMVNETNPGIIGIREPPAQRINLTLAIPDQIEFVDRHGNIIHLIR